MTTAILGRRFARVAAWMRRSARDRADGNLEWRALHPQARAYVGWIIAAGVCGTIAFFPRDWPHPILFSVLLLTSCLTSAWKVNLPISLTSGSTLSVSYAADLTALILLGPREAVLVGIAGAWTQCTFHVKRPYPLYRTVFSMSAEAVTMIATGLVYTALGGASAVTVGFDALARPLVGAIATYFFVNTGLIAGAIALSTRQSIGKVWHDDFLWSGPTFMVAGAVGALAALVIEDGAYWKAILMLAPVYLTYRTYDVFLNRFNDQRRHFEETQRLHEQAVDALLQARHAEQALAEEKERLAVTLRSIADGVITTDLDGKILSINKVAETLTGWTNEEAVGKPLADVYHTSDPETREPSDNSVAALTLRIDKLGAGRCTLLIARDLTERPIEDSAALLRHGDGRVIGVVLAFRDITDTIRIQEERAKASKLASLGLLAGGIAHDFNNILMAIMGNVSMARATMPHPPAHALAEAEQACVRARQLTWQLLTFSKGGVPTKKNVAIARILQEAASLVLRGSALRCTIDAAPDLWSVEADESQLIQVFSNVLINAQQAMPHGGLIDVKAENVSESEQRWEYALHVSAGSYVRVSITDKGIGIPKEHLGKIFDPYFSTKQKGSGLGLATTYSIVKNHGGFLTVDSTLGSGTTVQINLPASPTREITDVPAPAEHAVNGRHRILVMDDESSVRTLAINMLEFLGYEAEVVDGGTAAIERFAAALKAGKPFDIVMLDLIVPGDIGGKEAVGQLTGIDPAVKAILVSGYAQDSVITEFRDHGFHAVITKPFTLQELSTTLRSVIAAPAWRVH
jgi:PAS domain S-box-containing protein